MDIDSVSVTDNLKNQDSDDEIQVACYQLIKLPYSSQSALSLNPPKNYSSGVLVALQEMLPITTAKPT